jgi:hypothetical protein
VSKDLLFEYQHLRIIRWMFTFKNQHFIAYKIQTCDGTMIKCPRRILKISLAMPLEILVKCLLDGKGAKLGPFLSDGFPKINHRNAQLEG